MAMRLSGLMSGMDTESIIQQLVEAKSTKVTDAKNDQTKLEWKQEIWKDLNSKLKNLKTKYLDNLRFTGSYTKKTTKVSDSSAVSVITGDGAVNGVQNLEVKQLAKTAYLTGGKIEKREGSSTASMNALLTMDDLMTFEKDADGKEISKNLTLSKADGSSVDIELTSSTSISDILTKLKDAGLNASFDAKQQRFFISAKESGADNNFTISGDEDTLNALGLNITDSEEDGATFIKGQNAVIMLNNAKFESNDNVFEINGLTFTALKETAAGESVTVTTMQDTDGIYDMIKDFFKAYNEVMIQMDKLYNADSAKDYEPLSDDEKKEMSDTEIEKYEQKIKDSLLRRDDSINKVASEMKKKMLEGIEINGETMYLSNFGIGTLSYFTAAENEKSAYHIDGNADDEDVASKTDKLKSMIASDPDTVISFFSKLSQKLYEKMNEQSQAVEGYRSYGNFYDDKKMKSDYDDYKTKIKKLEEKLSDYEDKWYSKFSEMETAMAKMQQNASAVTSLLGGSQ